MTVLFRAENLSLSFGEAPLLDKINFQIEERERIFLIGRNGMGKSCLLKTISGQIKPDGGKIYKNSGLKIASLPQELEDFGEATVYEVVSRGLEDIGKVLNEYHSLIQHPDNTEAWLNKISNCQQQLDAKNGWQYSKNIETLLTKLELNPDAKVNQLSGGWKRRVALAESLIGEPDILLLDEPTNHLDLAAIEWLENFLSDYQGSLLCITHDRALLKKLSHRLWELDRGNLLSFSGSYDRYLEDKEHRLEVEANQAKLFDDKLAKEETWIRQGIKARRTRNEGRVRALKKLRQERLARRELQGNPKFASNIAEKSGKLVVAAENISFAIQNQVLVKDFSTTILRGDKIALVGPNGVGKTTLLKLLIGELTPSTGKIQLGTKLEIGYFDQLRLGINMQLSAVENVAGGREFIEINGKSKHVISYLSDFLFTPERARTPVNKLSGGECNRLLLAKLFSLPTNLLMLDEPTNDLDIESLELLESILVDYAGTVLLVSHDRSFVDEVATSILYFSGFGKITEFVGGYSDIPLGMLKNQPSQYPEKQLTEKYKDVEKQNDSYLTKSLDVKPDTQPQVKAQDKVLTSKSVMNSKLKRELEQLPDKIASLESELQSLQDIISSNDFYGKDPIFVKSTLERLRIVEDSLQGMYQRWEELENYKNS